MFWRPRLTLLRRGAVALMAVLAAPALALAQGYQGPPSNGAPPPPGQGAPWAHGPGGARDPREAIEAHGHGRLQALHDILRIRPDQESAFQAFAAAHHPEHAADGWRRDGQDHDRTDMAQLTTPERLDRMGQMMDERETRRRAALERRATAAKTLYAALSPDQRKVMDALPTLEGHGDHGWGDHGWGGRGDMGHGMGPGPHGPMAPPAPPPPPGA